MFMKLSGYIVYDIKLGFESFGLEIEIWGWLVLKYYGLGKDEVIGEGILGEYVYLI